MNKIFKILSSILIVIGIVFLYYYIFASHYTNKAEIFNYPSYYIMQNYWYIFVAGGVILLFSVAASFLSWLNVMNREESLPNAAYSQMEDINTWVGTSSLDTQTDTTEIIEQRNEEGGERNE